MGDIPTRIRGVELRCSDVGLSAEFYSRLTGLEIGELGADRAALRRPGESADLLVLTAAERPGRAGAGTTGLFHTAFRFADRAALGAALVRLAEQMSTSLTGVADHGVSEALYLDDPDGLGIELYRDRPREQWPDPEPGEKVHMFTVPLDVSALARDASDPDAALPTPDIGHVHLKVADVGESEAWWIERAGFDLTTRFGRDASFLGLDDYHHHIGINSWGSRGGERESAAGPGLQALRVESPEGPVSASTPDRVEVELLAPSVAR